MNIGILGSGDVGRALGKGFLKYGHAVKIGSRDPKSDKLKEWLAKNPKGTSGTFTETAAFGELLVLATKWSGTEEALMLSDLRNFAGKTVIDCTNPLIVTPGQPPSLALGHTDSGGEQVQRWLPNSNVVKAFNIVGSAHMVNPDFPGGPPDMFICGNDATAKSKVTEILTAFGWNTTDLGGIEGARLLEPMCILWVLYGMKHQSWNHAFKMLKK
ncbi:MAG TPA: NAD(P)-binding domain-containing protein [Bacteroidota bacterium]|nr:NAD(P)-binding domain-containing protein [Bacteroidota bacterium]